MSVGFAESCLSYIPLKIYDINDILLSYNKAMVVVYFIYIT